MLQVERLGNCELLWSHNKCPWVICEDQKKKPQIVARSLVTFPANITPRFKTEDYSLYSDRVLDRYELREIKTQNAVVKIHTPLRH